MANNDKYKFPNSLYMYSVYYTKTVKNSQINLYIGNQLSWNAQYSTSLQETMVYRVRLIPMYNKKNTYIKCQKGKILKGNK